MKRGLLLLLVLLITACSERGIYSLKLKTLDGQIFSFSALKGKRFIVYVWSGTCVGHTEDLKELVKIHRSLEERGYTVLSVALMMREKDVREVLEKNSIDPEYTVLSDPEGAFADKVKLVFLPATIVFNERGEVVSNLPGLRFK